MIKIKDINDDMTIFPDIIGKTGVFGIVENKIMRSSELNIYAKAVYSYLLSFTAKGYVQYPKLAEIQKELQITKIKLKNALLDLYKKGIIDFLDTYKNK